MTRMILPVAVWRLVVAHQKGRQPAAGLSLYEVDGHVVHAHAGIAFELTHAFERAVRIGDVVEREFLALGDVRAGNAVGRRLGIAVERGSLVRVFAVTQGRHALQRQLEASQDRFDVGEVTRTDVAQSQARVARAVSDRSAAEGFLEQSRATFLRVIGQPASGLVTALEPVVRANISVFALLPAAEVDAMVAALRADLETGAWARRNGELLDRDELDLGYRLLIAE